MTKSVKYTAIWKEWKINPHLLRRWSTCKVWLEISHPDFVSCLPWASWSIMFVMRFYKRLPFAIISSFCSNASCSEQLSWFSSAVSWLSCSSAPVSFKDSCSTTTSCPSPSLVQYTYATHFHPRKKISGYYRQIRMLYLTWPDQMSLTKQRNASLYKRVVLLKTY